MYSTLSEMNIKNLNNYANHLVLRSMSQRMLGKYSNYNVKNEWIVFLEVRFSEKS